MLSKKRAICDVYFVTDKKFGLVMSMVQSIVRRQEDKDAQESGGPWLDQFKEAIIPGGKLTEDGDETQPGAADYILHCVSFTWKVRSQDQLSHMHVD